MGSHGGAIQEQKTGTLAREGSLYNLTFDEVQNQLGNLGKPLGSMNLDELQGNSYKNSSDNNKNNSGTNNRQGNQPAPWTWVPFTPPSWPQQSPWNPPPCPYPTTGWAPSAGRGAGVLGPRPQAFLAQNQTLCTPQGAFVPTDIAANMQTMSLQQPDENWYMDTGASSHMTSNSGYADGDATYAAQ